MVDVVGRSFSRKKSDCHTVLRVRSRRNRYISFARHPTKKLILNNGTPHLLLRKHLKVKGLLKLYSFRLQCNRANSAALFKKIGEKNILREHYQ